MKHLFITTLLLTLIIPAMSLAADPVKHVKADEAAKIISAEKVVIVDVRTPDEFKDGHIKGAKNIDIMSADFEAQLAKLDKTQPTLVHCQAGGRSTRALPAFEKLGFTHLIHMDDGFGGWVKAGKPVAK